jgi:hypothetical protein
MQDGEETYSGSEMLWVSCDPKQSLGGGLKQEIIKHSLVLQGHRP